MAYLIQYQAVPKLNTLADVQSYLKKLQVDLSATGNIISNHTHKNTLNDFKAVSGGGGGSIIVDAEGLSFSDNTLTITEGYAIPTIAEIESWNAGITPLSLGTANGLTLVDNVLSLPYTAQMELGGLQVITSIANDHLVAIGSSSDIHIGMELYNGLGQITYWIAAADNDYMPGTNPGDSGIRFASGNDFIIGDTSQAVFAVTNAGVGVFNLDPFYMFELGSDGGDDGFLCLRSSLGNHYRGHIYSDTTYGGIRMDTYANAIPIWIDGSEVNFSATVYANDNVVLGLDGQIIFNSGNYLYALGSYEIGVPYHFYVGSNIQVGEDVIVGETVEFNNGAEIEQNGSDLEITSNLYLDGGLLHLDNTTSNHLCFAPYGVNAPTVGTRSVGTKMVFYDQLGSTDVDYAIGIDSYNLWISVPNSGDYFTWYAGDNIVMALNGEGILTINDYIYFGENLTSPPTLTGDAYGARLVLFPLGDGTYADYAIGLDVYTMWFGVPDNGSDQHFSWYGGITKVADLDGTGAMELLSLTATTFVSAMDLMIPDPTTPANYFNVEKTGVDNNVTFYNYAYSPSYGFALQFASSYCYSSSPVYLTGSQATVEFWIKPNNITIQQVVIDNRQFSLQIMNGAMYVYFLFDGYAQQVSSANLVLGMWQHIAMVVNGTQLQFFFNGVADTPITLGSSADFSIEAGDNRLFVGTYDGLGIWTNGAIDEIRISDNARYSSSFTPQTTLYSTDSDTIALYHFDEGTGTTVSDSSGNGYDMTEVSCTWITGYVLISTGIIQVPFIDCYDGIVCDFGYEFGTTNIQGATVNIPGGNLVIGSLTGALLAVDGNVVVGSNLTYTVFIPPLSIGGSEGYIEIVNGIVVGASSPT